MVGNQKMRVAGNCLLLSLLIFIGARCDNEKPPEFVTMAFVIPITIQPAEEMKKGDTLWISGSFADTLKEYYSGIHYQLTNVDFKSSICISKLVSNQNYLSQQPGAIGSFTISNKVGDLQNIGSVCGSFSPIYEENMYRYKIGLIPTSTGIFCINFLWPIDLHGLPEEQIDLTAYVDLGVTTDGRKRIPVYEAFCFVVNNENTNYELFTANCRPASVDSPSLINTFYEQKGSFTFKVVD
jgi:hypothetical protein